tara:strand:+ start:155 stop:496 length:342 start_codon:yes stop_codon:yes gene_type:complete
MFGPKVGIPAVNQKVDNALIDANLLILNSYASAMCGSMARSAARGRMPGWQAIKAFNEFQNLATTIRLGDPTQYMGSMLSQTLPAQPAQPVDPNIPPAWAQDLIDRITTLEAK